MRIALAVSGAVVASGLLLPTRAMAVGVATPGPEPVAPSVPPSDVPVVPVEPVPAPVPVAPSDQPVPAPPPDAEADAVEAAREAGARRAAGPRGRLAVGDSLLVSVTPWLRSQGFRVHAQVGRQFSTAPAIVRGFGSRLPRNLVVELGTNGTVSPAACRTVVSSAGKHRRVFLVTPRVPRSWEAGNLRTLRSCDARFASSRVRIIDWHARSAGHPEWFAGDGVHLTTAGRLAFSKLIDRAVDRHGLR